MDQSQSHESEPQFGSDPRFGSDPLTIDDMSRISPEQRVAANVSQQLLSHAFESQNEPKQENAFYGFGSELETGRQTVPIDVLDQSFNPNVNPEQQNIADIATANQQQLGAYHYDPDFEEEYEVEEDDDSLGKEPNNYESRTAVEEVNIDSDLMFGNQSKEPLIETPPGTHEEVLYQLSGDSNVLTAQKYGIGSDLRIDQNLGNVSVYELNREDPFQTPEKKVAENKGMEQKLEDFMSEPFETVSTHFGISSKDEINNLLDIDINSPQMMANRSAISHSFEVKDEPNHSLNSSDEEDDVIALHNKQEPYVVTSRGESDLPTSQHLERESISQPITERITNSSDSNTKQNDIELSPKIPNLEQTYSAFSEHSIKDTSKPSSHLFSDSDISLQQQSQDIQRFEDIEQKSETPFVPITKSMANTKQEAQASSTTSGTCPFGPSEWFNPKQLNPMVAELIYWRNPKNSGIVFGSGLVILISLTFFSIISVIAYASLAALSVTLSFRIYKNILQAVQKTNEGHPFKEYLEVEITPSNERIHQIADSILTHFNCTINKLRSVFLVEDIVDSLKFVVLFWCLTYIGSWFNGLTLIILAYLALFSLPKVYEMNKSQIDHYLNLACTQIHEITSKVRAKIPFPAKKEKDN